MGQMGVNIMKKIIIAVFILFLASPVFSEPFINTPLTMDSEKPIEAGITFDWPSKNQFQRNEDIKQIQNILFNDKTIVNYSKKQFKSTYSEFLKQKDYLNLYDAISNGKKEDEEHYYCGFYVGKLLITYGVQYKKNMKNIYYYDAMGSLRWVDVYSEKYPCLPYWSYQYYRDGKMVAAYYYVSIYDQYIFDADKKFKGRWYKDKLYNSKAKVIMTRTNW